MILTTKEEIILKINTGSLLEHYYENLELKSKWSQDCGKKLSAISNKNTKDVCWLCVGIDNYGKVCNTNESWAQDTEELISQHINQYLDPQQTCNSITCHCLNKNWFIIVEFKNPGAVVNWNKRTFKASGTTISEMQPEEIMGLTVSLPGTSDYSAQKYNGKYNSEFVEKFAAIVSKKYKTSFLDSKKELPPIEILKRLGIQNKNASKILFGDCKYRLVYYDNLEKPISNETKEGLYGILQQNFIEHIQDWSKQQLNINSNPYPSLALKEAFSNAVAHAAYFENQGDIIIEIHPDRLSISNLCMQESTYFANKWFSNAHKTVNKTLMEILRLSGYVDELGRGKNLIFSESLRYGKKPPKVIIETSGRYSRWRLFLYGGIKDKVQLKLYTQLEDKYKDAQKALIANALVLWSGKSVTEIKKYIEGESKDLLIEVLKDLDGPIFYWKEKDEIVLRRWVKVLLGEGKESKKLTDAEEKDTYEFVREYRLKYFHGYVTPKDLRDLAHLGQTKSSQVMSSQLLKKWEKENKIEKIRKGQYKFKKPESISNFEELIKRLDLK